MVMTKSTICPTLYKYVMLPTHHRAGLPGNEISFFVVPLDQAYKAGLAGHLPVKKRLDLLPSESRDKYAEARRQRATKESNGDVTPSPPLMADTIFSNSGPSDKTLFPLFS
jgi:hypothetical protein